MGPGGSGADLYCNPIKGHVTPRESKLFLRCIMPVDYQTFHAILRLTHEIYECKLANFLPRNLPKQAFVLLVNDAVFHFISGFAIRDPFS